MQEAFVSIWFAVTKKLKLFLIFSLFKTISIESEMSGNISLVILIDEANKSLKFS